MDKKNNLKEIYKFLQETGVKFVRFIWCDNANIIRGKAVHVEMLSHYFEHGVGISAGQQGIPVMYDAVVPETDLGPVGEIRLVADWSSLKPLLYAPGHARVMGNMILNGSPWALCPRDFLKRMIAAAKSQGLEVRAAFENEFYLLRQTPEGIISADSTVFASTQAMDINYEVINEIADALIAQGIPVEQYYPEYSRVPIVLLHASYPYMREAGYLASVYPQVYLDFGLAVPFLSVSGMRETIRQLLELTPTTKLMYASDAHSIPELYYLGAKWGRQLLGEVLWQAVTDSDITVTEAEASAVAILRENALFLYQSD